MIVDLSAGVAVVVDVFVWTFLGVAIGYCQHRLPQARLAYDGPATRIRTWEAGGRSYQRYFRIRSWKTRLPEAGDLFLGGVSKRSLPGGGRVELLAFAAETRRAERVHWLLLTLSPLFLLWNPPVLSLVMLGYAVVANVPFIMVQRFNRARIETILGRRKARTSPADADSAHGETGGGGISTV